VEGAAIVVKRAITNTELDATTNF